jgi:hypothetical protein
MAGLSGLADKAKAMFTRRGGTEAAKEDAQEMKDIHQSEGSTTDKAKEAGEALKDPGAPGGEGTGAETPGGEGGQR